MFTKLEKTILNAVNPQYRYICRFDGRLYLGTDAKTDYSSFSAYNHLFKDVKEGADPICFRGQILDDTERRYLKFVLKPFAKRIDYVTKIKNRRFGNCIWVRIGDCDSMNFPYFNDNKNMYKGMEFDTPYTLEELGITYDNE